MVAGAGYAGVSAYLALRGEARAGTIALTVVNLDDAHLMLPELPLFLAGEEGTRAVRVSLAHLVRPPAALVLTEVRGVDPAGPALLCADPVGRLAADGVVLALGSTSDDFGVPGVAEHAIAVGRWEDALALRRRLLRQYRRRARGRVVVVGGGLTGVEVAAELASVHGAREGVALVAPSVLPSMPREVRALARAALGRLGVRIVRGRAGAVEAGAVALTGGERLDADTVIWAGGIRGNAAVGRGLRVNRRGQALVARDLRAAPRLYCAGDCAAVRDAASGGAVGTTAQAAIAEGALAARNLLREMRGEPREPFHDRSQGFLVSLGRGNAAGVIGRHVLHGREVAALKHLIEVYHAFQTGGLRALGVGVQRTLADAVDAARHPPTAGAATHGPRAPHAPAPP